MTGVELRDGNEVSMTVPLDAASAPLKACIALPAASRDAAACAGLPLDALPADTAEVVAYVRGGTDTIAVSIKRVPGHYGAFESGAAHEFATGYVKGVGEKLPAPMAVIDSSVKATTVRTADGQHVVSVAYDLSGVDPKGPMRLVAHQHAYALPTEDALEVVIWTTSAGAANELEDLSAQSALTLHASRPAHPRAYNIAYAIGMMIGAALPLAVIGVVVWVVFARARAREQQEQRAQHAGAFGPPPG